MTWQISNVGWPIPLSTSWPVSDSGKHRIEATPYLLTSPPVQLYGSSLYYSESQKGQVINTWS